MANPKTIRDVLGGKHDPHDLAAEATVLQDFLADQLTLAIAVRGKPDTACRAEGGLNGLQLARRRLGPEEPLRTQKNRCPALPVGVHLLWLKQRDQVPLGRRPRQRKSSSTRPRR
jgi:hypothetical protein